MFVPNDAILPLYLKTLEQHGIQKMRDRGLLLVSNNYPILRSKIVEKWAPGNDLKK